jgi:hypothetical protein
MKNSIIVLIVGLCTAVPAFCGSVTVPEPAFPLEFGTTAACFAGVLLWYRARRKQ